MRLRFDRIRDGKESKRPDGRVGDPRPRRRVPASRIITAVAGGAAVLVLASPLPTRAQESAATTWPPAEGEAPRTEPVLEAYVTIDPAVEVGASDHGTRRFIPITGGRFVGDGLRGRVLPGGADWQLERPDGVLELYALYSLETDDGQVIVVENEGVASNDVRGGESRRYLRTSPRFHAPRGEHDWLNKSVFVGTVTPEEDGSAVVIRVFRVVAEGETRVGGETRGGAECTDIASSVARLDCYDNALGRVSSRARPGGGDQDSGAAALAERDARGASADPFEREAAYTVTVVEVRARGRDAIFITEEGETWVQNDGRRFFAPDVPFSAEIRPGALGSRFLVPSDGGRAIRVRRP